MREGLRSRKRLERQENDDFSTRVAVQKEENASKQAVLCSSGEDSAQKRASLDLADAGKEVDKLVKEECALDWDMDTSTNVEFVENGNNRRVLSYGDGIERKVKKKGHSNDKLPISGRVLRSQSRRADGQKSSNGEDTVLLVRKSRERHGFENMQVKAEKLEGDECVSNGYEKEKAEENKEENIKRRLKRKRGRPPKMVPNMELNKQDGELPQKVGRPLKAGQKVGRPPKAGRKVGRPPKAEQNYELTKLAPGDNGKVGCKKGRKGMTIRDGVDTSSIGICAKTRSFKEIKKEDFPPDKIENNEVASPLRSTHLNVPAAEKSGKRKAQQLVRDQILELLMAAGWTVDYRPRNGRIYHDAVYVSLDGKTHWSITLAYNRLKKHYEDGDGEGMVYGPGFKFTPIPEEDFKTLTKVMTKKRSDSKTSRQKGKGGKNIVNGVDKKVKKEEQGSSVGVGNSMKRKTKRKRSLIEDNSDVTLPNRTLVLGKDRKRQRTRNKKRSALLVRNVGREIDSEVDGYVPYNGKRTVLAWMIDLGTVLPNAKVHYMNHSRKDGALEGRITRDGIDCGCCDKIVTISQFQAHAGIKLSDPFRNICIEGGTSLLQCLLDSWNKQDESERKGFHLIDVEGEDPNDDTCGVCGDGGDLICCDGCPSTFHQGCLDIKKFPFGDWHCIYCCCSFCGLVGSKKQRNNHGDIAESALLACHLCEQKYHKSCIGEYGALIDDSSDSFCGNRCQELYERLKMLLGVKHEIGDGFSWSFVHRSDVGSDASQIKSQTIECNSKLAVALLIMDECFMPYIDHRSGINLIHSILYNCGSNFNRLNHSGFVTAILERGDEIICAASIRFRGNQLAEMPFIGTRSMYRRQGMCRRLLSAIECALSSLKIGLLVIPAIAELRETWTSVFGFEPLDLTSNPTIKNMNLLVFPHVDMLQKKIPKPNSAYENLIPTEVSNPQLQKNQEMDQVANNCYELAASGSNMIISAGVPASDACQINDKSSSHGPFNNTPVFDDETVHHNKCSENVKCQVVCQAIDHNLTVEDKGTTDCPDYVRNVCVQDEHLNACQDGNSDCIIKAYNGNTVDLDNPFHIISGDCQSTQIAVVSCEAIANGVQESSKASNVADLNFLPVDRNISESISGCDSQFKPNGVCVPDEVVLPTSDLKNLMAQSFTENLPVNCTEPTSMVDELDEDVGAVTTPNHINSGDCQSTQMAVVSCEAIANGVQESSKASNVADLNFLPVDSNISESISGCDSQFKPNGVCVSDEVVLPTSDLKNLMAQSFTENLPVNCTEPTSMVDELDEDVGAVTTPNHINSGDCQSTQMAVVSCEAIANGVQESSKASNVADLNFLPVDSNIVLDSNLSMDHPSELLAPGLQVDNAAQSNGPSLCSPNNTGVALHLASSGGTSCGVTEAIVLSNQVS